MKNLAIRPWLFKKDEIACLQWIGSPFQSEANQWFIDCIFSDFNGNVRKIELPFGTLPGIKIGRKYRNGIWIDNEDSRETFQVNIPKETQFNILSLNGIPRSLYNFKGISKFKDDLLCSFQIGEDIYFLPCIEVVGSILAPYQAFANKILTPSGLEDFIEEVDTGLNIIHIKFTSEYPKKLLRPEIVAYFSWLKYNADARREWNAVYRNLLELAAETCPLFPTLAFKTNLPLKAIPPMSADSTWKFKGMRYKNNILIQEITYRSGLEPAYTSINYTHSGSVPGNNINKSTRKSYKRRRYEEGKSSQNADNIGLPSKKSRSNISVRQQEVQFLFAERVRVGKERNNVRNKNAGYKHNKQIGFGKSSKTSINIGTTQDWTLEGKLNQIEFFSLQMVKEDTEKGLEKFLKVLENIRKYYKSIDFEISVVYVPSNRAFSVNDSGNRRKCAVVKAYSRSVLQCYILELSRIDEWPISTLFIKPVSSIYSNSEFESLINKLLCEVSENGGHWNETNIKGLTNYKFEISKHIPGQDVLRWTEIIANKILEY